MIKGLPERLKSLRLKHGYSQKLLAEKLRVSPSIVSAYETGERTPSTENLLSLSFLYNISVDYLLGRDTTTYDAVVDVSGLSGKQVSAIIQIVEAMRNK